MTWKTHLKQQAIQVSTMTNLFCSDQPTVYSPTYAILQHSAQPLSWPISHYQFINDKKLTYLLIKLNPEK